MRMAGQSDAQRVEPQDLVEAAVSGSDSDATIAIAHVSAERNIRFAANKLTTVGDTRRTTLNVVASVNDAVGSARGDVATLDEAVALTKKAEAMAVLSKRAADAYNLPDGSRSDRFGQRCDLESAGEFFGPMGASLEKVFTSARGADLETFGFVSDSRDAVYLATSAGVRDGWFEDRGHVGITAKTGDWSRSVWSGQTTRRAGDLDPAGALEECRSLLGLARERREIEAGRYDVVLTPSCVADMLTWQYWLMSLRDADEGKSVFSDRASGGNRIGEKIYPDFLRLSSDPAAPGFECIPFVMTSASHSLESVFDNGMPVGPVEWIGDGLQKNLVSTREYALRAGVDATPFVGNLLLEGREDGGDGGSVADLVAGVERGLLVNCLWYIRIVDPQSALLTGLTRDGVFLIENGEVTAEVNNFRFNQSPVGMLANVKALGRPQLATPREFDESGLWVKAPPALVSDWNMSTVSEAL